MKGWRTITLGIATMLLAGLQANTGVIPEEYVNFAMQVVGSLIITLRLDTDGPVGVNSRKESNGEAE